MKERDILKTYSPDETKAMIAECTKKNAWKQDKEFPKDPKENLYMVIPSIYKGRNSQHL